MNILYETKNLIVVVKPAGVLSEESGNKQSVPLLLRRMFLEKGANEISTVFRLNQSFSDIITGIILFFIIGSEFFINYQIKFHKAHKEAAK